MTLAIKLPHKQRHSVAAEELLDIRAGDGFAVSARTSDNTRWLIGLVSDRGQISAHDSQDSKTSIRDEIVAIRFQFHKTRNSPEKFPKSCKSFVKAFTLI